MRSTSTLLPSMLRTIMAWSKRHKPTHRKVGTPTVDRNAVLVMGFHSQDILSKILESFGREESAMTQLQCSLGYKPA